MQQTRERTRDAVQTIKSRRRDTAQELLKRTRVIRGRFSRASGTWDATDIIREIRYAS